MTSYNISRRWHRKRYLRTSRQYLTFTKLYYYFWPSFPNYTRFLKIHIYTYCVYPQLARCCVFFKERIFWCISAFSRYNGFAMPSSWISPSPFVIHTDGVNCIRESNTLFYSCSQKTAMGKGAVSGGWGEAPSARKFLFFWQKLLNFRPILVKLNAIKTWQRN